MAPMLGMLHDCVNMCGEPARMELVEGSTPREKATFRCTGCGVEEEKKHWTPFLSFRVEQ